MAERFNVPPWKGGVGETLPGVRIPLSPPKIEIKLYNPHTIYPKLQPPTIISPVQ